MSDLISPFDRTRQVQWRASNPAVSAWVSANAGSGKTHVLSQRVLRLLLQGVPPAKIVCLTYTKAAAANMAMKVFSILSKWTRLNDEALRRAIADVGVTTYQSAADLAVARQLFARTVETPGGLKIQTIHAFCERLLHLFPFEAGVAAGFKVMEDDDVHQALKMACEHVFAQAMNDAPLAQQMAILTSLLNQDGFMALMRDMLGKRHKLQDMLTKGDLPRYKQRLAQWLKLDPNLDRATLEREAIAFVIPPSEWKSVGDTLMTGSVSDKKNAEVFYKAHVITDPHAALSVLHDVFLTEKKTARKTLMTKALRENYPDLFVRMEQEQRRIIELLNKERAFDLCERTYALFYVFQMIASQYFNYKAMRGTLDFDDLIARTVYLLSRSTAAQWVLYKLDSGIDHILVDEAQDTSPDQWLILDALAQEFTAGAGQSSAPRSFFAVGDEKQSIYSFQGAEPDKFSIMRAHIQKRMHDAQMDFEAVPLHMSFRSAPGILARVDRLFANEHYRTGLSSDNVALVHDAWKSKLPSHVEIWPVVEKQTSDINERNWRMPVDALDQSDPIVLLAQRIARSIHALIAPQSTARVADEHGHGRAVRAGDIMILVRKRGPIFNAIIRALKEYNVPVAGADRLMLNDHLAVMDVMALGRALLLPDDDLSLACVLKSPFFDMTDDDLLALAPQRGELSLWQAVQNASDPRFQHIATTLHEWRRRAHEQTPFEFYSYILHVMHGRRKLFARLGPEAGDALDEFLRLALHHERTEPPSLNMFLASLEGADITIKRDMEAAGDYVRVMTAHAAKGLEAKIVYLPDTTSPAVRKGQGVKPLLSTQVDGEPLLFWSKYKNDPVETEMVRAQDEMASVHEHRRLLYVALTRAEERLYIMGAGKAADQSWYQMIHSELIHDMEKVPAFWDESQSIWRLCDLAFAQDAGLTDVPRAQKVDLPSWLTEPAPVERQAAPPISPSSAMAAADQFDKVSLSAEDLAMRAHFGRLMHVLVQYLPMCAPAQRAQAAQNFIHMRARALTPDLQQKLYHDALALFDDPLIADLFRHPARAEVALAGKVTLPHGKIIDVVGQIDLLLETPEAIVIVDFKTGAAKELAHTPDAYLVQLALYSRLLRALYQERQLRSLLIWTSGPHCVELPSALLEKSLSKIK